MVLPRRAYVLLLLLLPLSWACTAPVEVSEPGRCEATAEEPMGLMLTWQQDPTTTMTIDWHTSVNDQARSTLCFKKVGEEEWTHEVEAAESRFPFDGRPIFRTELTGLEPGTEYAFQVGEFGRRYTFRTMPADIDESPLVFATGGDTLAFRGMLENMNRTALQYDPDFIAWGGDLAYADGRPDYLSQLRWQWWFDSNLHTLVTDEGRVVPILVAIGNHEVRGGYYRSHDDYEQTDLFRSGIAPYFYSLFAFPGQPGYAALDFGQYLTLIALDTDHTNPVAGSQTEWLRETLSERREQEVTHVLPFYHVPAYPSHRSYEGGTHSSIREHWVPLFEKYGVQVALENHDHTYKRTHPIRKGEIDPDDGIVYMGDGAWGMITRTGDSQDEWYIDRFAAEQHGIIVTLRGDRQHYLVVRSDGTILDEYGEHP